MLFPVRTAYGRSDLETMGTYQLENVENREGPHILRLSKGNLIAYVLIKYGRRFRLFIATKHWNHNKLRNYPVLKLHFFRDAQGCIYFLKGQMTLNIAAEAKLNPRKNIQKFITFS